MMISLVDKFLDGEVEGVRETVREISGDLILERGVLSYSTATLNGLSPGGSMASTAVSTPWGSPDLDMSVGASTPYISSDGVSGVKAGPGKKRKARKMLGKLGDIGELVSYRHEADVERIRVMAAAGEGEKERPGMTRVRTRTNSKL